jgi:hypothetical protein
LAPGNSIGDITTTSLNVAPGATYQVEFNGAGADKVIVTPPGGATVKGGIEVVFYPGSIDVASQVFTIIDHASQVHDIAPDISLDPDVEKNGVYFDAATAALFPSLTPYIRTVNDNTRTELYFGLYRNLGLPRTISSVPSILGRTNSLFVRSIFGDPCSRLAARGPSTAHGLTLNSLLGSRNDIATMVSGALDNSWVQGYGETISANQGSGDWGYDFQLGGVSAGLDLVRRPNSVVGLAFGLSESSATHDYKGDRTSGRAYDFGVYAHAKHGEADVNFVAFLSKYALTHTRFVDMGITTKPAVGKPDAYRAGIALGYDAKVHATPTSDAFLRLGLGGGLMSRSAFTETGDEAIAMNFDAARVPYFQFDLGLTYGHDLFRSDKSWRLFGEAMLTRHVSVSPDPGMARFVTAVGNSTENTVASPEYTYLQVRPAVGVSWNKGSNSAELKLFTELRAGKSSPGASFNYRHQF